MYKILTLNKISPYGLDNFDRKTYTYGTEMENPDAIIVRSAKMHDMEFSPNTVVQILKDDAVKVLHSICQQIWKTQQWPQDWKRSVFIPIP